MTGEPSQRSTDGTAPPAELGELIFEVRPKFWSLLVMAAIAVAAGWLAWYGFTKGTADARGLDVVFAGVCVVLACFVVNAIFRGRPVELFYEHGACRVRRGQELARLYYRDVTRIEHDLRHMNYMGRYNYTHEWLDFRTKSGPAPISVSIAYNARKPRAKDKAKRAGLERVKSRVEAMIQQRRQSQSGQTRREST